MKIIKHHTDSPEEMIALDELFLSKAEKGEESETIRFWESASDIVVLGRAGRVNDECLMLNCHDNGVKIIRRLSGGGAVAQGRGCLNYSLVLSYSRDAGFRQAAASYYKILGDIARVFAEEGHDVNFFPVSDLALGDKKFSGNAQARKRSFFLHHGTVLYGFDIGGISRYLKHPPREPEYRKARRHNDFMANIDMSPEKIKKAILKVFPPEGEYSLSGEDIVSLSRLIDVKYSRDTWNFCF